MRFIVLSDNHALYPHLEAEHGLSVYLEKDGQTFLFDTGASDVFIRNARKLNIDLSTVDYLFISHAHYDHIGGLRAFMEINHQAKIILSKYALNRKLYSNRTTLREIGNHISIDNQEDRFLFVDDDMLRGKGFYATHITHKTHPSPKANRTLFKEVDNILVDDDFEHEILVAVGEQELFLYTGCAHHGLLNMLSTADNIPSPFFAHVLGGFHLVDGFETDAEIKAIASTLKSKYPNTTFYTGHCTGENAIHILQDEMGEQLQTFAAGLKLVLPLI